MSRERCSNWADRGFTLVELIVAIGVMALLVAIILPSLRGSVRLAQRAQCAASLRSLTMGLNLYGNEQNQLPVTSFAIGLDMSGVRSSSRSLVSDSISMQLVLELARYVDATVPSYDHELGVLADQPWVCPAERTYSSSSGQHGFHPDGFSYDYFAGALARPDAYPDSLRYNEHYVPTGRGIGRDAFRLYLSQPGLVILADDRPFHAEERAGASGVDARGWNHAAFDGSVRLVR